jgi:hypothetical protein
MTMDDSELKRTIREKTSMLSTIVAAKFGGNAEAAATSGEETQTGGGNTMKVTRSAGSGAPGEVQDGKLVDVKSLAAAAARNDVPPTDLLALARENDPHNEHTIPTTIAGAVTASDKGLPGQEVAEDHSQDQGNLDEERKKSLHSKQHAPIEKAVETKVESQVSDKDPYKTLHAGHEIDSIVARAKAVMTGADAIRAAASEVAHPGAGKVEDGGQGKVEGDAGKNAVDSAKTLGNGGEPKSAGLSGAKSRADVLAAIRSERKAKVEGALEDPAKGGAAQTPEEGAKSMGDGGSEKSASTKVAEQKDRPLASMPDGKKRYPADDDNRDEEAASYWKKNKADESRFDKEPKADRPITREMQEKMPALASRRLDLITRLAGLARVFVASEDEAARLHFKKRHYNQDKAEDMDYGAAAGRTKSEINKEHGQRSSDSGSLSPMMSRLWSAYMPNVKLASNEAGYKGEIDTKDGDKKKQVAEMQKALKGLKAEDKGAEAEMASMEKKIGDMESDLAKSSGVALGQKSISALATAQDRLAVISAALHDIGLLCRVSHMETKFALEKPHGTGVSNDAVSLLEDLGETIDDMEGVIDMALKDLGHPGLKDKDKGGAKLPGDEMGGEMGGGSEMPMPPMGGGEPKGPPAPEGALPDLGAKTKGAVKTAFEIEDETVEKLASDEKLSADERKAKITEARAGARWTAVFNKVASAADANKPDMLVSYWQVLRGDEPVLKVSAAEAYPVKTAAEQAEAFAWFATKDYGLKLLASAKFEGLAKTAKLLGLSPLVKSAAGAALDKKLEGEKGYYSKAFGSSEYAAELLKDHEKKAAAEKAGLEAKVAALEADKKAQTERNDRLQSDIAMRAKAAKALDLAAKAMSKGMLSIEHKASFIDGLMLGDDQAFKVASAMVENFKPVAPAPVEKKAELSAKELLRIAAAGPGLKTPIVSEASAPAGLTDQLNSMWKVPPTAKA